MERKKDKVVLFLVQLAFYTVLILNLLSFRGVYELPYRRLITYLSAVCIAIVGGIVIIREDSSTKLFTINMSILLLAMLITFASII